MDTIGEEDTTEGRHSQSLQFIKSDKILSQAFDLEPRLYDVLREINALLVVEHRGLAYHNFKEKCDCLVGFGAAKPELRTSHHYAALLDLFDHLLSWVEERPAPLSEYEVFTPEDDDPISTAIHESQLASRQASLQVFRDLA